MVYFPFKNQLLVRTDVAKLDMSEDSYKRFYYKRDRGQKQCGRSHSRGDARSMRRNRLFQRQVIE